MNKQIIDMVFTLARLGIAEVAKDTRNGAQAIAVHASALEQWRAEMEKQLMPLTPAQERVKKLEQLAALQAELRRDEHADLEPVDAKS